VAYLVPIAAAAVPAPILLTPSPAEGTPYDTGQEYPADPLRLMLAWVQGYWQVVATYNGK